MVVCCTSVPGCDRTPNSSHQPKLESATAPPVGPPGAAPPVSVQKPATVQCVPVAKLPRPPRKLRDRKPPPWSEMNVQTHGGTLVYEVTIGPSGDVTDVRQVKRGSPAPATVIANAWLRAIREWKFEPTIVRREPVPVCMIVTVTVDVDVPAPLVARLRPCAFPRITPPHTELR